MFFHLLVLVASTISPPCFATPITVQSQSWIADCDSDSHCGLPVADGSMSTSVVQIPDMPAVGQAGGVQLNLNLPEMQAVLHFYVANPPPIKKQAPYVQVQLQINSPLQSLCAEAVRWENPLSLPSLVCGSRLHSKMRGVTLVFLNQP